MLKNTVGIFIIFLFFALPQSAYAQVVINEINPSGEWVELYKTSQGALSLENCTIYFQDTKSQKKILTQSDNFLESEVYKVIFTGSSYLNNSSSDTVSLECPSFTLDPVAYGDNMSDKSYARIPNATGSFVVTEQTTQGLQNPDPTPVPTPSPSPSPTSEPTSSPTKSPNPTQAPTSKPAPTKSPSPKPTATPTEEAT